MSEIERLPWETFVSERLSWQQGEHVAMIGPTGSGKTTLALALLPLRDYVIAYATKPKDSTMDRLVNRAGWKLVRTVEKMPNVVRGIRRIVFWPKFVTPSDQGRQAYEIGQSMNEAFVSGGWCLFIDELWYMEKVLGLGRVVESLLTQGRSIGLTIVAGTQRPAHVTLLIYDQCTHLFLWRDNDERNLKRLAGINGLNADVIRSTVATLPRHEVLYVNTRTGYMAVTKAPRK